MIAHPFAAALVRLGMVRLRARGDGEERGLERARDAYLDVFADRGPAAELGELLEVACQVGEDRPRADVAPGAASGARAGRAGRSRGWATTPLQTLATVLDEHYLGA